MDDLTRRALAAYVKSDGPAAVKVSTEHSGTVDVGTETYTVLRNRGGHILAVYRLKTTGTLRRLKRYPPEIAKLEGS